MGLWVVWNVDRSLVSIAPLGLKMWLLHRRFLSAKRKPRPPCRGFLPLRVPPPSSRESHCTGKWLTGATKWRQVQINSYCPEYTGGFTAIGDGFPSHHGSP